MCDHNLKYHYFDLVLLFCRSCSVSSRVFEIEYRSAQTHTLPSSVLRVVGGEKRCVRLFSGPRPSLSLCFLWFSFFFSFAPSLPLISFSFTCKLFSTLTVLGREYRCARRIFCLYFYHTAIMCACAKNFLNFFFCIKRKSSASISIM